MGLISFFCDSQKPLLSVFLSLLPSVILKSPKKIRLFFRVIFLYNIFLIFLINIYLSIRSLFIALEGPYKAKTASVVFLILNKKYCPAGSVMIHSIGGAVIFASTKKPQVCAFVLPNVV